MFLSIWENYTATWGGEGMQIKTIFFFKGAFGVPQGRGSGGNLLGEEDRRCVWKLYLHSKHSALLRSPLPINKDSKMF